MEQYYEGGLIKDGRGGVIYKIHLQTVKSESICSEWTIAQKNGYA